jgi:hypothetical protein
MSKVTLFGGTLLLAFVCGAFSSAAQLGGQDHWCCSWGYIQDEPEPDWWDCDQSCHLAHAQSCTRGATPAAVVNSMCLECIPEMGGYESCTPCSTYWSSINVPLYTCALGGTCPCYCNPDDPGDESLGVWCKWEEFLDPIGGNVRIKYCTMATTVADCDDVITFPGGDY